MTQEFGNAFCLESSESGFSQIKCYIKKSSKIVEGSKAVPKAVLSCYPKGGREGLAGKICCQKSYPILQTPTSCECANIIIPHGLKANLFQRILQKSFMPKCAPFPPAVAEAQFLFKHPRFQTTSISNNLDFSVEKL